MTKYAVVPVKLPGQTAHDPISLSDEKLKALLRTQKITVLSGFYAARDHVLEKHGIQKKGFRLAVASNVNAEVLSQYVLFPIRKAKGVAKNELSLCPASRKWGSDMPGVKLTEASDRHIAFIDFGRPRFLHQKTPVEKLLLCFLVGLILLGATAVGIFYAAPNAGLFVPTLAKPLSLLAALFLPTILFGLKKTVRTIFPPKPFCYGNEIAKERVEIEKTMKQQKIYQHVTVYRKVKGKKVVRTLHPARVAVGDEIVPLDKPTPASTGRRKRKKHRR